MELTTEAEYHKAAARCIEARYESDFPKPRSVEAYGFFQKYIRVAHFSFHKNWISGHGSKLLGTPGYHMRRIAKHFDGNNNA